MALSLVASRRIVMRIASSRLFFGMLSLVMPPIVVLESMPKVMRHVGPGRYSKSDVRCATKACVASTLVRSLVPRAEEFT